MRRETVWRSMYSDMSKRISSIPIIRASWRVTSVFPTPVGPANRNEPIGFAGSRKPERDILIAAANVSMAWSWPYTTIFRSRSKFRMTSLSDVETVFGGMRAIFDTTCSISATPIVFFRREGGSNLWEAPASSITSMALSGRWRSLMYRSASSVAKRIACREYFT